MAEHKYAQVLRWIADGKTVEARLPGVVTAAEWDKVSEHSFNGEWFQCLVMGDFQGSDWEFRLKPRTVKIGNREVEAPVLEPAIGRRVYFLHAHSANSQCEYDSIIYNPALNSHSVEGLRGRGLLFASREAAEAFYEALSELLQGLTA